MWICNTVSTSLLVINESLAKYLIMSDGQETREDQLRNHVSELKEELERSKAEKRQIHHDKVREVRSVRESEQARAHDQLEALRNKLHKEKSDELQAR